MAWAGSVHLNNYLEPSPLTDENIKACIQLKQQKEPCDKIPKIKPHRSY